MKTYRVVVSIDPVNKAEAKIRTELVCGGTGAIDVMSKLTRTMEEMPGVEEKPDAKD